MGDGANDALRSWIKAGMPRSNYVDNHFNDKCPRCGTNTRTITGNWTTCKETGERHRREKK